MLTRKQRPYLSNDCSLFHCVEARTDLACSLGSGGHTRATIALCSIVLRQGQTSHAHSEAEAILVTQATIALCSIVLRQGQTLHAHSEAEAILEQRLLFVSLC